MIILGIVVRDVLDVTRLQVETTKEILKLAVDQGSRDSTPCRCRSPLRCRGGDLMAVRAGRIVDQRAPSICLANIGDLATFGDADRRPCRRRGFL